MTAQLLWHNYRYYPYERDLAFREVASVLECTDYGTFDGGLLLPDRPNIDQARRLTYFSGYLNGHGLVETTQGHLEKMGRAGKKRQSTRYSVHGVHEYKGKFHPQVVRAILNIFGTKPSQRVFDPFCGSGTTLVECMHMDISGFGTDLNPLAVFIANAKLQALSTPIAKLRAALDTLSRSIRRTKRWTVDLPSDPRGRYLRAWFPTANLHTIEALRFKINDVTGKLAPIFLTVASNLLRDYSLQDPNDLRIRRRSSPLPEVPFLDAFLAACVQVTDQVSATQELLGVKRASAEACRRDVTSLTEQKILPFDAAITSPPYAMALPYIDTQRLSLVWLSLISPDQILELEAQLVGSREIRGGARKELLAGALDNSAELPQPEADFCLKLHRLLAPGDGFRRQAVPMLLYRYFSEMQKSFAAIRRVMKLGSRFALIVGHNHTVLGGVRCDINTPEHLASIAVSTGWQIDELIPLQTYQRYGYHMSNAVSAETLLLLRSR